MRIPRGNQRRPGNERHSLIRKLKGVMRILVHRADPAAEFTRISSCHLWNHTLRCEPVLTMNSSKSSNYWRVTHALNPVTTQGRIGLVAAGYAIAIAVAAGAVGCHLLVIGGPARQAYTGMNVFGEGLLFLAVFGIAALPPTAVGWFVLRPYPAFWRVFSGMALVIAGAGLAALGAVTLDHRSLAAGVAFPLILIAPLFTLLFGSAGLFAPHRTLRVTLLAAAAMEIATFAGWLIPCLVRNA
jgi:hypothetical protein